MDIVSVTLWKWMCFSFPPVADWSLPLSETIIGCLFLSSLLVPSVKFPIFIWNIMGSFSVKRVANEQGMVIKESHWVSEVLDCDTYDYSGKHSVELVVGVERGMGKACPTANRDGNLMMCLGSANQWRGGWKKHLRINRIKVGVVYFYKALWVIRMLLWCHYVWKANGGYWIDNVSHGHQLAIRHKLKIKKTFLESHRILLLVHIQFPQVNKDHETQVAFIHLLVFLRR